MNARQKSRFHTETKNRLQALADVMALEPGSYEIRSNPGGPAVSGEITLHHDHFYLQVANSIMGPQKGILIRTCKGRNDYSGGHNNFAPLSALDDLDALAARVRGIQPAVATHEQLEEDLGFWPGSM